MSNLKRIRTDAGLSQSELSERSGVNVRLIQDYEQGHKPINNAKTIACHSHRNALQEKRHSLFKEINQSVDKRKQR